MSNDDVLAAQIKSSIITKIKTQEYIMIYVIFQEYVLLYTFQVTETM